MSPSGSVHRSASSLPFRLPSLPALPPESRAVRFLLAVCLFAIGGPGPVLAQEGPASPVPPLVISRLAPQDEAALVPPPAGAREALAAAVREGVSLVRQREYARVVRLLEPYRELDHFTLLHALGIAYVRLDRNEEAYAVLMRAHALRPEVAAPLLPAALACVKMARTCDAYRGLAREYKELGGQLVRFADKIAHHVPVALVMPGLRGDVH